MAKAIIIKEPLGKVRRIRPKLYPKVIRINETIPFRVSFTNIMVPGYGPNNIPGIGIQVIGYSNYIL